MPYQTSAGRVWVGTMRIFSKSAVLLVTLVSLANGTPAAAQAPRVAPDSGFALREERRIGPFVVQQWISASSGEESAAGACECITLVYMGEKKILTAGGAHLSAISILEPSGADINGDGFPDLVVTDYSGGAHCCYTTTVYSVSDEPRQILSVESGHCGPGEFADLDNDGTLEFTTCDDGWAYAHCAFAFTPFPRVVFAYDRAARAYAPATPRFAATFRDEIATLLADAQTTLSRSDGKDPGLDKCTVLGPALALMYSGRFNDGLVLVRQLYRGDDRTSFEQETVNRVRESPLWIARAPVSP
jgi:hypothetical protein